jgi:hypothetical protein
MFSDISSDFKFFFWEFQHFVKLRILKKNWPRYCGNNKLKFGKEKIQVDLKLKIFNPKLDTSY